MTDNAQDITAMTATDLAELLRVTPRRIRQLAEEGRLRRRGRGKFDVRHAIHGATGAEILGQDQRRNIAADVVVAVGWLAAIADAPAEGDNFKVWIDICAEWGLSHAEAMGLLIAGASLLGDRAPKFKRNMK
ncbi:hypothetical protein [Celeribacter halophilus]|uniref:hypothetical protein n=1 Tax=Celeribacter halophilus TaxID=576117 RepID=UPI001C08BAC9|nr:hypothetical protein [Celeribacter halophilus]MBU2890390.1 hypothetical protein [Celeribacter halophilus]MDO6511463.1 hypothetical protein [Celeribacter halophilus]